jgi:hypothetical protein
MDAGSRMQSRFSLPAVRAERKSRFVGVGQRKPAERFRSRQLCFQFVPNLLPVGRFVEPRVGVMATSSQYRSTSEGGAGGSGFCSAADASAAPKRTDAGAAATVASRAPNCRRSNASDWFSICVSFDDQRAGLSSARTNDRAIRQVTLCGPAEDSPALWNILIYAAGNLSGRIRNGCCPN